MQQSSRSAYGIGRILRLAVSAALLAFCPVPWSGAQTINEQNTPPRPPRPPDVVGVRYGPHERNDLDLYLAKSDKPAPLVLHIHGGAFVVGNKNAISPFLLDACAKAGITVASINYRYATQATFPAPYLDGARALQFLRLHAKEYNLNPNAVAATGGSAGADISLWLGFHDDLADPASDDAVKRQSTRVCCVGALDAQTSLDPRVVDKLLRKEGALNPAVPRLFGLERDELDTERAHKLYNDASAVALLTKDDAPVFLFYRVANKPVTPETTVGDRVHNPAFGFHLKEHMDKVGVECLLRLREDYEDQDRPARMNRDLVQFFVDHFPGGPVRSNAPNAITAAATPRAASAAPVASSTAGRKPNVVFILGDDIGWGDLGCYGNRQAPTPNLDRMAAQGTLFTQFYVNGSVCSPSRCAFLTGHFPAQHRMHAHLSPPGQNQPRGIPDWLDPSVHTLPKLLKKAGYATAHFGKWHLGAGPGAPPPTAYGFDASRSVVAAGDHFSEETDEFFRAHSADLFVSEAIKFIEANRDRPFYVNVWMILNHATLHPTPEQLKPFERYNPAGLPYQGTKAIYYASLAALDAAVGRLVARLDELGLAQDTIVVFSADNGPEELQLREVSHSAFGSAGPFRGRKRSLYEGGVREPWIVRWPGHVAAGRVDTESVVTAVDWLPTICGLAGVPVPSELKPDGENGGDILLGRSRPRTRPIMWEWRYRVIGHVLNQSPMLSVRDGRWKLLLNPDRSRVELYDIPADPSEMTNLAAANPDVVARLAQQVLAWQKTLPPGPIEPGAGTNGYPWPKAARGNIPRGD